MPFYAALMRDRKAKLKQIAGRLLRYEAWHMIQDLRSRIGRIKISRQIASEDLPTNWSMGYSKTPRSFGLSETTRRKPMSQLAHYRVELTHKQSVADKKEVRRISRLITQFCDIHGYTYRGLAQALNLDEEEVTIVVAGLGSASFAKKLLHTIRLNLATLTQGNNDHVRTIAR